MNLTKIIKESKTVLNESVSSRVFHFLPIAAMANIAENDTIEFSSSNRPSDKILSKGYPYYLSLSRTSSDNVGYVRMRISSGADAWKYCIARIEFDGDKLNANFKGGPVNYFNDSLANVKKIKKDSIVYSIPNNKDDSLSLRKKVMPRPEPPTKRGRPFATQVTANMMRPEIIRQTDRNQMHEYEDRIFSEYSGIEGVNDYIKRIDILIKLDSKVTAETKKEAFSYIGKVLSRYGDKVNIYTNEVAFNSMNIENTLNKKEFISSLQQNRYMPIDKNMFLRSYSSELKSDYQKEFNNETLICIGKALYCASYVEAYYNGNTVMNLYNRYLSKIGLMKYRETIDNGVNKLQSDIAEYGINAIDILPRTAFTVLENYLYGNKRKYYNYIMELYVNILNDIAYFTDNNNLPRHPKYLLRIMYNILKKAEK